MTTLLRDRLASLGKLPKKLNYGDKIVIDGKTYVKAHLGSELDKILVRHLQDIRAGHDSKLKNEILVAIEALVISAKGESDE